MLALRVVQEQVSAKVDACAGELTLVVLSAHVYESDVAAATRIIEAYDQDRPAHVQ